MIFTCVRVLSLHVGLGVLTLCALSCMLLFSLSFSVLVSRLPLGVGVFFTTHYTCVLSVGVSRVGFVVSLLCSSSFFNLLCFLFSLSLYFSVRACGGSGGALVCISAGELFVSGMNRCLFPRLLG